MLRLRMPACTGVSMGTAFLATAVAEAGAGDILSAICAMKVPRPARMAAVIKMLRMTPHTPGSSTRDLTMPAAILRRSSAGRGRHFGEKDERRVNASGSARLDPARRQRVGGILRPGM